MKPRDEGSVLLESVLILPVLMMIIFFMIQFPFVLLAKQMTYYAAYCGARSTLVYNPLDYRTDTGKSGVVHRTACTVLAWISHSTTGSSPIRIPVRGGQSEYEIPRSDNVYNQVTVAITEPPGESLEEIPTVTVDVYFDFPLLIPYGGLLVAMFSGEEITDSDGWHYVRLKESCTLAKPYRTETYPLMPEEDRTILKVQ